MTALSQARHEQARLASKPIIFLDIDGVLNNQGCYRPGNVGKYGRNPDPQCIAALNSILDATGAEIVVSSTWRMGRTVEQLREMLTAWGVRGRVVGATPTGCEEGALIVPGMRRGHEIGAWLVEHPEVERFVILDDDADMAHLMFRLVRTDFSRGLTKDHAARAIVMLRDAHTRGKDETMGGVG